MLNTEAINLLRDMHRRARELNKDASRYLRDRAAIDSGASETMTNNLALVSHPVRAAITVQQPMVQTYAAHTSEVSYRPRQTGSLSQRSM